MAGVLTRLVGYRSHGVTACSLWLSHCPPSIPGPPLPTCASATVSSLLAKQFCHLQSTGLQPPRSAPRLSHILSEPVSSPLNGVAWQQALAPHPDRKWVEALCRASVRDSGWGYSLTQHVAHHGRTTPRRPLMLR